LGRDNRIANDAESLHAVALTGGQEHTLVQPLRPNPISHSLNSTFNRLRVDGGCKLRT
jgi:hypothetical protein